jgi:KUP system potassium uptake protein
MIESSRHLTAAAQQVVSAPQASDASGGAGGHERIGFAALALSTLGVVYGDIGTSPLYALRECFHGPHAIELNRLHIFGVLSLVFWSLILIISVKYIGFVMRADNKGEGGILALMSLVVPQHPGAKRRMGWVWLGLFGAALLYGDGIITPAISVLSAVEGLEIAAPGLHRFVVPLTIGILVGLFVIQRHGTSGVGIVFGPIILVWFVALGALGIPEILKTPDVLRAVSPLHAIAFMKVAGFKGFMVLGSVFLVVTGGEALYADMGHVGARMIRLCWFAVVLPALLLNYWGQGALLLRDPSAIENPFFLLAPQWALIPLIALSTAASCIASQAVISGAFSLTRQAVLLGYIPRVKIRHTSAAEIGQIYIPAVNWALMLSCIGLVLAFRSSSGLAAAYGIAVTTTMVITTVLWFLVAHERWGWSLPLALVATGVFLVGDVAFFAANVAKIFQGGWFAVMVAGFVFLLMTTWKEGRNMVSARLARSALPLTQFLDETRRLGVVRVQGTAVYMTASTSGTPPPLVFNTRHNKVLHRQVILMTVIIDDQPRVPLEQRVNVSTLAEGVFRMTVLYGFMDTPDIYRVMSTASQHEGLDIDLNDTTFFLGRETLLSAKETGLSPWREKLFAFMARNSERANLFFQLPPERVMEIGAQVEI